MFVQLYWSIVLGVCYTITARPFCYQWHAPQSLVGQQWRRPRHSALPKARCLSDPTQTITTITENVQAARHRNDRKGTARKDRRRYGGSEYLTVAIVCALKLGNGNVVTASSRRACGATVHDSQTLALSTFNAVNGIHMINYHSLVKSS